MLSQLSIRDIVLIEALDIDFSHGLSVLTGETGAGKSILLDALSMALGARGDASLVRHGAVQGQVIALFDLGGSHPVRDMLRESGIEADPSEPLILRRVQTQDGRTRGFVNNQPASAGLLRMIGRDLVEIHGQHDDRALVDTGIHRELLDAFGGLKSQVLDVEALHGAWRGAERVLTDHRKRVEDAAREADYLHAANGELVALAPEPGEEADLAEKRAVMMRAEKIAGDLSDAHEVLSGQASPVPQIAGLLRRLERKAAEAPGLLEEVNEALGHALDHLADAQGLIETAVNTGEFDPRQLEAIEERLFALRAASRKFNVAVDDLPALAVDFADQLAELDAGQSRLAELEKGVDEARAAYDRAAEDLSQARQAAKDDLVAAVMRELPDLKLERAEFIVQMETDAARRGEHGIDDIEFWVRTNPGTRAGPMMKVASGGELSRFLLALKVALADRGSAPTLVFDEIDTGVGGAVADAIGSRLRRLAETVQVLSVTHAPQVAARAAEHFLIAKKPAGGETLATSVHAMGAEQRREEIARMLAGATITDEARAAAAQLLKAS
ncbi:DNA repair protein RecN [Oricola cellulosilytica]|uniref:DNA repair protein RecN n=1 Tax=Oricola cellulosilytica TaxID=1429082 RepID=A0A4R0PI64_9HYPH|nr:DNA repair protein RecN [Oricola cellulosilytica]TCD15234.1 DNA repair protein RecN [Oricola cellulosilytica]